MPKTVVNSYDHFQSNSNSQKTVAISNDPFPKSGQNNSSKEESDAPGSQIEVNSPKINQVNLEPIIKKTKLKVWNVKTMMAFMKSAQQIDVAAPQKRSRSRGNYLQSNKINNYFNQTQISQSEGQETQPQVQVQCDDRLFNHPNSNPKCSEASISLKVPRTEVSNPEEEPIPVESKSQSVIPK